MTTQEKQTTDEKRAARLSGMQELVYFLQANSNVPLPYFGSLNSFPNDDESVSEIARSMKPVDKDTSQSYFTLTKTFDGGVKLSVNWTRDAVCERIVIGTEEVPEYKVEAHTRDIVEWKCPEGILDH